MEIQLPKLFILLSFLLVAVFILPSQVSAECVISANTQCSSDPDNGCPAGQEMCTGTDGSQSCYACRTKTALSEQTCSEQYSVAFDVGCATGSNKSLICGQPGAPVPPNCFSRVNSCGGGSCSGLRSGEDEGCNYCVTPISAVTCKGIQNGLEYSCQNGSSCPSGSIKSTAKSCNLGQVCCYASTSPAPAPTCTPEKDVVCNQTISSYDDNVLCPGTGTKCIPPTNICTVDGCGPPPNPCPAGEVLNDKFLYSCVPGNSSNSCPVGSQSSSKTCSSGKTCCYSLLVGPPKEKTEGWCSVFSAVSTGTNSATVEGDRYGFNRMDWYLSKNNATPIFHHTSNVAQTKASIEQFIDHSTTFNNLSPKTKYTVTAKGWCQTPECTRFSRDCLGAVSFPTDPPKQEGGKGGIPPPSLQCWGSYEAQFAYNGVAWWTAGTGTGVKYTANFNLPGTSGYKIGNECWHHGVDVEKPPEDQPQPGTLGGRIYVVDSCTSIDSLVKNTAKLTQPQDFGNILYWVWSTADNGGPMCMLNNGTYCQLQDNSLNYISASNKLLGTITENNASPLYSGNSVSLISWDSTRFKPLGYYRYQHSVGKNCFEGPNGTECTQHACEPIPNNTSGTGSSSTGTGGREFFHWGGWLCDGCTGSPGYFSKPLVNNFYPNPDAPYCLSNDPAPANAIDNINPNGRIDFVFERTGNSFTVSGYVYQDTNKNGVQDGGETTGIPDVTINLSGAGSTQTIQTNSSGHYSFTNVPSGNYSLSALTPEGYKLTTPESKDITVGCDGLPSQNFLARTSYYISGYVKNDVNFDGECSESEPSFAGTVTLTNNIANRQPILLSGNGDYIFDDLPIPNILSPNKTYTYKVTADIGITPTSGLPYQEILTLPPSKKNVNFCIQVSSPWVQTDGDVHSNTGINMPKGPKPK